MRRDRPVQHPGCHDPGSHIRAAFSRLAPSYERMAVLERAAGERLLEMLAVRPQDSVLDLGCGPGHLTRRLRTRTKGKLVGIDLSAGMIAQARWRAQGTGITFLVGGAEDLDFDGTFNIIFCNSALQWFTGPGRAVDGCYRALRRGGWLGVQVPATRQWCSLVRDVMTVAAQDPRTGEDFRRFRDPVFFMATAEEYVSLFNRSGFEVHDAWIERETTHHTPEKAFSLLLSMAGAALFNPACYESGVDDVFFAALEAVAHDALLVRKGHEGLIEVNIHRLYLLAIKSLLT